MKRTSNIVAILVAAALGGSSSGRAEPVTADPSGAPVVASGTSAGTVVAGDEQTLFAAANKRYFAGDWTGATQAYAAIVERFEVEDAALYHNLGNACFRSGAYGLAILYYRRAQKLEPDTRLAEALERNLDAARRTLQARYRTSSNTSMVYADPSGVIYQVTHLVGRDRRSRSCSRRCGVRCSA